MLRLGSFNQASARTIAHALARAAQDHSLIAIETSRWCSDCGLEDLRKPMARHAQRHSKYTSGVRRTKGRYSNMTRHGSFSSKSEKYTP